jgi:DtxR family transcriptional regulator, Mn-dependent transcriptional regulator
VDVSRSVQDYLKAIYKLQGGAPVQTSAVAEQLRVAAPSATNMIGKLAEAGYLRHTPYRGVELTEVGAQLALRVIRRHRLWELFLHQALGLPIEQLHGEAERLEHELSDELEAHISRHLGEPTHDPHGDPIPTREGALAITAHTPLSAIEVGAAGVVRRVPDSDPELLRYLSALGLLPGAGVEMRAREPFKGPLSVRVDGVERVLGHELASRVLVEPTAG